MLAINRKKKFVAWVLLLMFGGLNFGCTKEKAEAIKTAAEQFRVEAKAAIDQTRALAKQDAPVFFTSSGQEAKSIAINFQTVSVSPQEIARFVNGNISRNQTLGPRTTPLEESLSRMEQAYELFGSMFRSLPRGNFLAKNAVKKSKVFAIKLTIEMVNLAKALGDAPFEFSGRRQALYDQFQAAQKLTDPTAKNEALLLASQQLIKLRDDEAKANSDAIVQCLKGAEAGKLATDLIDRYQSLTVDDILDLIKNSLSIVNDVTGGNNDVSGAITRYDAFVKNKINTDPLWKDVLKTDVKSLESLAN